VGASHARQGWSCLEPEVGGGEANRLVLGVAGPVALTGATGFVGSHVASALAGAGVRARLLVRDAARLDAEARGAHEAVLGDLDDGGALESLVGGCQTVFHLAGVVRAGRATQFDRANRQGTQNLLAAMGRTGSAARCVYVSSLAASGPSSEPAGRLPEETPCPVSAYGKSKLAGEEAVRGYGGPWVILRPPAIYGPRDVDVFQFFRLASRGIVPVPWGERFVTVAHVADVVRAVLASASGSGDGHVLHIGEPRPFELLRLVRRLAEVGGVRARTVPVPVPLLRAAGLVGDVLQFAGLRGVAITSDKTRELIARHWTAQTEGSLALLGLGGWVAFDAGAAHAWEWYRREGWLPRAKIPAVSGW